MTETHNTAVPSASNARSFPVLSEAEEKKLVRRWKKTGDREALDRLIESHLRLVPRIARKFSGYGINVNDLISEGHIGLMQSVERFKPEKGFRFSTYARWWIRAAILNFILQTWSLIKVGNSAGKKKLFFNLRKLKGRIQAFEEGDMTPEHTTEIATRLKVSETEVINMNRRMAGADHSLNAPLSLDGDGEGQWQDWLKDDNDSQEEVYAENEILGQRRELLAGALEGLSGRESHILEERRLKDNPTTLEELSQQYGISRERVRQIEVRAFEKVKKSVRSAVIHQQYNC